MSCRELLRLILLRYESLIVLVAAKANLLYHLLFRFAIGGAKLPYALQFLQPVPINQPIKINAILAIDKRREVSSVGVQIGSNIC